MLIYVDVDETICKAPKGKDYSYAEPMPEQIAKINELYDTGEHEIVYWTARGSVTKKDWSYVTRAQLEEWGAKHHRLEMGKPAYDLFIDDKVLNSRDWHIHGNDLIDAVKEKIAPSELLKKKIDEPIEDRRGAYSSTPHDEPNPYYDFFKQAIKGRPSYPEIGRKLFNVQKLDSNPGLVFYNNEGKTKKEDLDGLDNTSFNKSIGSIEKAIKDFENNYNSSEVITYDSVSDIENEFVVPEVKIIETDTAIIENRCVNALAKMKVGEDVKPFKQIKRNFLIRIDINPNFIVSYYASNYKILFNNSMVQDLGSKKIKYANNGYNTLSFDLLDVPIGSMLINEMNKEIDSGYHYSNDHYSNDYHITITPLRINNYQKYEKCRLISYQYNLQEQKLSLSFNYKSENWKAENSK